MGSLLDHDVDTVIGRQCLFEPDPDTKSNDGSKRAVGDGWCDLDENLGQGVGICRWRCRRGRGNVDIRQIYYRELTEGQWVLWVRDGRNEVCETSAV